MTSIIEDSRATAEDVDVFERALTKLLMDLGQPSLAHRERLATSHRASDLVDRIVSRSQSLRDSIDPKNEERTSEIERLTGNGAPGGDLAEFYQRLAKVKEYHRKYPDVANVRMSGDREVEFAALEGGDEEWLDKRFTGEEGLGRYMDLHELHEAWNNLSPASSSGSTAAGGWKRLSYLQYLSSLTRFELSPALKSTSAYSTYLTSVLSYLSSFHERILPLTDLDALLKEADERFGKMWNVGTVQGWSNQGETTNGVTNGENGDAGANDGIWCAACQKMYSKKTVFDAHLTSKKHVKASAKLSGDPSSSATASSMPLAIQDLTELRHQKNHALALKESLIRALVDAPDGPLSSILADTISNSERRAALTDRERAMEIEELEAREAAEAAAAASAATNGSKGATEDDDEEERIYNPLKLPLGWDGKPIPFWLYKLHGLGQEYRCEICSDYVYQGRKNFERHFQESRHAFGMRALGLPNTKHFHEITRIEDAIALAEKLKQEGRQEMLQAEITEELEDDEGNVYNRKTWEDLKRQGLL